MVVRKKSYEYARKQFPFTKIGRSYDFIFGQFYESKFIQADTTGLLLCPSRALLNSLDKF